MFIVKYLKFYFKYISLLKMMQNKALIGRKLQENNTFFWISHIQNFKLLFKKEIDKSSIIWIFNEVRVVHIQKMSYFLVRRGFIEY
jgi:hypothetical protein